MLRRIIPSVEWLEKSPESSKSTRSSSQSGLYSSLATTGQICRIREGLREAKGTGERTNAGYQGDLRQFLSVGKRAGSL